RSGRHLWPGLTIGQGRSPEGAREVINQIMITRGMIPDAPGNVFFSMKTLQSDEAPLPKGLLDGVLPGQGQFFTGPYNKQALVPASPWLDATPPTAPEVEVKAGEDGIAVSWKQRGQEPSMWWVGYAQRDGRWSYEIVPGATARVTPEAG